MFFALHMLFAEEIHISATAYDGSLFINLYDDDNTHVDTCEIDVCNHRSCPNYWGDSQFCRCCGGF